MWHGGGSMGNLGILMKDNCTPPGILTLFYTVILTMGDSDIEFCNKNGCGPWGL